MTDGADCSKFSILRVAAVVVWRKQFHQSLINHLLPFYKNDLVFSIFMATVDTFFVFQQWPLGLR